MPLVQKTQARVSSPGPPEMARADPRPLQIRARCRSAAIKDDQLTRAEQLAVGQDAQSLTRQQLGSRARLRPRIRVDVRMRAGAMGAPRTKSGAA